MTAEDAQPRKIDSEEAQRSLPRVLKDVKRRLERVVVEEDGVPVAAIVPIRDLYWLKKYEAQRDEAFKAFAQLAADFADEDPEEVLRQTDLALAEVREEMRRERIEKLERERTARSEA
jgi:antitoxin (DNA-binding transcriptional repressor) of toxin-antitoxin stability system